MLSIDMQVSVVQLIDVKLGVFVDLCTETERSSDWQLWCSLETLKLVFNVSSEYQGCQPDDIFVSVCVPILAKLRITTFAEIKGILSNHDVIIKWKHFPRYWPFVHKDQWREGQVLVCVSWHDNNFSWATIEIESCRRITGRRSLPWIALYRSCSCFSELQYMAFSAEHNTPNRYFVQRLFWKVVAFKTLLNKTQWGACGPNTDENSPTNACSSVWRCRQCDVIRRGFRKSDGIRALMELRHHTLHIDCIIAQLSHQQAKPQPMQLLSQRY